MARRIFALVLVLAICLSVAACSSEQQGMIYLYGESHGNPEIMSLELELWRKHYHEDGMRHLFTEHSYFTAEFLNLWMQAEDDSILLHIYDNLEGTTAQIEATLDFYRAIKETCPETVFHGTDVGHQYWNIGEQFISYLEESGMTDSEEYERTLEAIEQGKTFYCNGLGGSNTDHIYRENTMVENFIREFEALDGESIMGIYGTAHVKLDSLNHTGECDSMGKQLLSRYGEIITSENLTRRVQAEARPLKVETLTINGRDFEAEYFGLIPLSESYYGYSQVEFWRLVDAYENFSKADFTGSILGESSWPMVIEEGGTYVVRYTYPDGRTIRQYHLCDGTEIQGVLVTQEVYGNKIH